MRSLVTRIARSLRSASIPRPGPNISADTKLATATRNKTPAPTPGFDYLKIRLVRRTCALHQRRDASPNISNVATVASYASYRSALASREPHLTGIDIIARARSSDG